MDNKNIKNTIDTNRSAEEQFANQFHEAFLNLGSIYELEISFKSANCLRKAGICNVDELLECDEERIKGIEGLGSKHIREVLDLIEELKESGDKENK